MHEGRQVWSTSMESAYTPQLAHAWASCAASALKDVIARAPVGRKRTFKTMCQPDFDVRVTLQGADALPFLHMFPPCRVPQGWASWPKGTRVLSLDVSRSSALLAVPCTPESWCRQALDLPNPRRSRLTLPPDMMVALAAEASEDCVTLSKARTEASRDIARVCRESMPEEERLRAALHPEVAKVTSGKRSVATERLLCQLGHVDQAVARSIREGFPIVDWLPASGLWDADVQPPELTPRCLCSMAEDITNRSVKGLCRHRDATTEQQVWDVTLQEDANGWLSLCGREELMRFSVVSPRFGVLQKQKVRPIDNLKASFVNAACGVQEKVQLDGIDEIVEACLSWLRFRLPSSTSDRIVGRTWDLKSAYKQLAVRADHKQFAVICVLDPQSGSVQFCRLRSLPFGAVAAVHAFLRCGEALKSIARRKLFLAMTSFFDDFTVLTSTHNSSHVGTVVSYLFQKLGWHVAPEEKKNKPFSEVFDVLGVRIDLSCQHQGVVQVRNTPQRIEELKQTIRQITTKGTLTYEEAQRLRGRLIFAEQQVWGRNAHQAVVAIGDVSPATDSPQPLIFWATECCAVTDTQRRALDFVSRMVLDGAPRLRSIQPVETFHLWLDGACERLPCMRFRWGALAWGRPRSLGTPASARCCSHMG